MESNETFHAFQDNFMTTNEAGHPSVMRLLQASTRNAQGRTVLTVLYLIVLALCFVVPVFYYFRLHCHDQRNRRRRQEQQREFVMAAMDGGDADTDEQASHPEARASRKKYRAERRARILQLLGPVSLVLREEHFHRKADPSKITDDEIVAMEEARSQIKKRPDRCTAASADEDISSIDSSNNVEERTDDRIEEEGGECKYQDEHDDGGGPDAEGSDFVEIPTWNGSSTRLVPSLCVICLQQYEVGEEIVWSSNPDCEHVFHSACIEKWLIKQRGGPLCPNCRRDFIIDPFDLEVPSHEEEERPAENQ